LELKNAEPIPHDELFKLLLETFFADFIDLFFPQVSRLMERAHLEFRPQEVITDLLDQEKHVADILVEPRLKGEEGLILIHVENQSQRLPDYNRRMFKYFARLYEKYQQKILPIVVYAHDAAVEEEDCFRIAFSLSQQTGSRKKFPCFGLRSGAASKYWPFPLTPFLKNNPVFSRVRQRPWPPAAGDPKPAFLARLPTP